MKIHAHPLDPITAAEITRAASILREHVRGSKVHFKVVDLIEAPKALVLAWVDGRVKTVDRKARVYYHVEGSQHLGKAQVNITQGRVESAVLLPDAQGPVDYLEWEKVHEACNTHPMVLEEVSKLNLPAEAKVVNDPWSYGTDDAKERRRLFQCYMYIVLNDDPEANHYSIPAPFAPVFDAHTLELLWIDRLPLGVGAEIDETQPWEPVAPVEYSASILGGEYFRKDLKPLLVEQPNGPSFQVQGRNVSWQKWNFQLGWNVREGPVLHNVSYDGRSLFYRVSMSEMTVPYGDPRTPFHRKQAFDLGDSGFGLTSNTLTLGCDCLGHIRYFDGYRTSGDGTPVLMANVVCMHEVDQGIGWKHTNFRNGRSSVVRDRQLVVQCTATVANYEYILAFILDQAANLHVEVKATGIVSTMPVAKGVQTPWGSVVAPGVMAVNHQHLFNVRVDPALDGHKNSIIHEDCVPVASDPDLDPFGCAFTVEGTTITKAGGYDLDVAASRTFKIINPNVINSVSGKSVGYKLHAVPSQMMMMGRHTFNYKRGIFASKPIWVTKYRDDELWAAGEFTNQSREDTGLAIWANRDDNVENEDVVLWYTFGVTHVTRPEDFPIMPCEKMSVTLKPSHFFELNPSNDVPRSSQQANRSTLDEGMDAPLPAATKDETASGQKCCVSVPRL
ncbi:copper amine oxidase [Exophiala viscosa]|uniref:Amine oxidase n=1 Tax=Exophiala viscosa TaxID=2486360 RepID=A0AAN6E744_9EURO|nr:copper amine oxidase [Exophiala viscosa]